MNIRRPIARCIAAAALAAAPLAHAQLDSCFKNHFILAERCAPEWTPVNEGLTDLDVRVVAIDPVNPSTLYAGGPSGIFKSIDGAASWRLAGLELPPQGGPGFVARSAVAKMAIDPTNPRTLYASTVWSNGCVFFQRRFFKSVDGGETWSDVGPAINGCDNIHALEMDPGNPSTLYVVNFDDVMGDTWSPVVRTRDGAASWDYLEYLVLNVLAIDPSTPRTLYGGTFEFPPSFTTLPNGVLKSRDGGETWAPTGLVDVGITALVVDPTNPDVVYAAVRHGTPWYVPSLKGIFKSVDAGDHWAPANEGLSDLIGGSTMVTAIVVDAGRPNVVYLATSGAGVFRSVDAGATWTAFNRGLTGLTINALALSYGIPNTLYASTSSGVFKIADFVPSLGESLARKRAGPMR